MFRAVLRLSPCAGTLQGALRSLQTASGATVGIIGAPFDKGQRREGVRGGPQAIRDTGVVDQLRRLGVDVQDHGDVEGEKDILVGMGPSGERNHAIVLDYNRRLAAAVTRVVGEHQQVCVTLGGDHSIAIGSINGHAAARPDHQVVVLWVDAHADLNTGSTSYTGNMHGMPVSHHLRQLLSGPNRLPDGWPQPCLDAHHIAYIGLRDVDDAEKAVIKKHGILSYGMGDVDRLGLDKVLETCLDHLRPSSCRSLHLSFDIDALDPLEAPSTGTPVRGGLSLREGQGVCEVVHNTGHLSALDLVEVNPELSTLDNADLTTNAARLLLLSALAGYRGV